TSTKDNESQVSTDVWNCFQESFDDRDHLEPSLSGSSTKEIGTLTCQDIFSSRSNSPSSPCDVCIAFVLCRTWDTLSLPVLDLSPGHFHIIDLTMEETEKTHSRLGPKNTPFIDAPFPLGQRRQKTRRGSPEPDTPREPLKMVSNTDDTVTGHVGSNRRVRFRTPGQYNAILSCHSDLHPAIASIFGLASEVDDVNESSQQHWNQKWRPVGEHILGNEQNACYLREWMHALRLHFATTPSSHDKSSKSNKKRGMRPEIVREVFRSAEREIRRLVVDDEDDEDDPQPVSLGKNPQHNTLGWPPGLWEDAAVYTCAEELGWNVFEVYPGLGKRGGTHLDELIGDVGRNHTLPQPLLFHRGRSEPPNSPQSVVLIEEADVVFADEAGFWPSVVAFIRECRRPVIITCNVESRPPIEPGDPPDLEDSQCQLGVTDSTSGKPMELADVTAFSFQVKLEKAAEVETEADERKNLYALRQCLRGADAASFLDACVLLAQRHDLEIADNHPDDEVGYKALKTRQRTTIPVHPEYYSRDVEMATTGWMTFEGILERNLPGTSLVDEGETGLWARREEYRRRLWEGLKTDPALEGMADLPRLYLDYRPMIGMMVKVEDEEIAKVTGR
ncbi:hypothetical protein EI94DRAFT_1750981, partial [Lactarius quietus]